MIPSRDRRGSRDSQESGERRARTRARWEQLEQEAKLAREEGMRARGMSEEEIAGSERIRRLRNSNRHHRPWT